MVFYKVFKTIIDISELAKVIINIEVRYYGLSELIISDCRSPFTFFSIKCSQFIAFYLQMDSQIKKQYSTIEAYLQVFVN